MKLFWSSQWTILSYISNCIAFICVYCWRLSDEQSSIFLTATPTAQKEKAVMRYSMQARRSYGRSTILSFYPWHERCTPAEPWVQSACCSTACMSAVGMHQAASMSAVGMHQYYLHECSWHAPVLREWVKSACSSTCMSAVGMHQYCGHECNRRAPVLRTCQG